MKYNKDFVDLEGFENYITEDSIVFIGEFHGVKDNFTIRKEMIMFLNENSNLKYLLFEISPADAYRLNEYLSNGDITILDSWFKEKKGTPAWTSEYYNFFTWLRDYHTSNGDKFIIVGCDVQHQKDVTVNILLELLSKYKPTDMMKNQILGLQNYEVINEEDKYIFYNQFLEEIENNKEEYNEIFNEDYYTIYSIFKSIVRGYEAYEDKQSDCNMFYNIRDKFMYENLKLFNEFAEKGVYFGQFGYLHTLQKADDNIEWFATRIKEDEELKLQVTTINLFYTDCKSLVVHKDSNSQYSERYISTFKNNEFPIVNKDFNDVKTLYKLDDKGSIFTNEYYLNIHSNSAEDDYKGVTTDYLQYFIRFFGCDATTPLNESEN